LLSHFATDIQSCQAWNATGGIALTSERPCNSLAKSRQSVILWFCSSGTDLAFKCARTACIQRGITVDNQDSKCLSPATDPSRMLKVLPSELSTMPVTSPAYWYYIAHFQVISYVFQGRAFHPRLARTHRRVMTDNLSCSRIVMRCVHPACLGRGLVPSYPSQSTIKQACRDGHGGSSTPSDSACSNTGGERPLARCESGNAPKILGHLRRF